MRFKTWPVAAVSLTGLLLLVVVSVVAASRRAQEIYTQLDQLNANHREVETKLRRLRTDVNLSGIFVRDYLLDTARERAPEYRQQLAKFRESTLTILGELRTPATGAQGIATDRIPSLQAKLDEYWETFEPLFDWTPAEKITESARFVRRELLPRRDAVLAIAQEIEVLNNSNLTAQREEVAHRFARFQTDQQKLLWSSLILGVMVALTAVMRLRVIERHSDEQRRVAEEAERQMRQLSQQLVATQEEERRKLSRELHDHVGQMLTALRMELGRIDRLSAAPDNRISTAVASAGSRRQCRAHGPRSALGLRPSMLDDFGLQPALEWHVRDLTRRYGLVVDLAVEGELDSLPDPYRTCLYRVVQEALTNCVRHAGASHVDVSVRGGADGVDASVSDDGVGVDPRLRHGGLGLRGIEERARELGGSVDVRTAPGSGTTVTIHLPLSAGSHEVPLARAAG